MSDAHEDRLERLLHGALRGLPAQRAPLTLESRVLEAVARRASQPWWRRSFGHWPTPARVGFVAACLTLVGAFLLSGTWMTSTVPSLPASGAPSLLARQVAIIAGMVGNLAASLMDLIPPTWLYVGLAAGALLYAFLFGLGAAAYRLLYLKPLNGR
jgi:hypothetical protein